MKNLYLALKMHIELKRPIDEIQVRKVES